MSCEDDNSKKIYSLESENTILKQKITQLENIIKSYKSQNLYFNNTEVDIDSPIFKSIPYVKRMNAFNYSNDEVNI